MKIGEEYCTANDIIDFATEAAKKIAEYYQPGRLPCGYLTIRSGLDGRFMLVAQIGECPAEKFAGWLRNYMEKAERLLTNPGHTSSWQSRDFDNAKYGGAIRAQYIVSFSGLPEHADEALCVATADHFDWFEDRDQQITEIFAASENENGRVALLLAA